jgi:hypothetical protein
MNKYYLLIAIIVLFAFFICDFVYASDVAYVDVHTHLVSGELPEGVGGPRQQGDSSSGVMQRQRRSGPGRGPTARARNFKEDTQGGYNKAVDNLISFLDRMNIKHAIVMSPPKIRKNQSSQSDYDEFLTAIRRYPDRLFFGAGGGNELNPLIHETDANNVADQVYREFDTLADKIVNDGAKCFGEMAVLHLSYSDKTHVFEECDADHPLFKHLLDLSAKYGLPIDLHMDCVPSDMSTPRLWKKMSSRNPDTLQANIPGFERLLAHNRRGKVVWQHVGRDTLNTLTPQLVNRLLSQHSNLYCAIWVRSKEMNASSGPAGKNQIVDENYKIKDEWMRLLEKYPDRFVIGTDGFFASSTDTVGPGVEATWRFLDMLPKDLAQKIGGENAARIYRLNER